MIAITDIDLILVIFAFAYHLRILFFVRIYFGNEGRKMLY